MLLKEEGQKRILEENQVCIKKKDLEYENTHMKRYGMKELLPQ